MKNMSALFLILTLLFCIVACDGDSLNTSSEKPSAATEKQTDVYGKPVIYLYPEEKTTVTVKLKYDGELTSTYPEYKDGWTVVAEPDGTLTTLDGEREYYCLFWEGIADVKYDLSRGFVVSGKDTEEFLEKALATLGLTDKEANEFIIYWLPKMEHNEYNFISFQDKDYTDVAELEITPRPDSILRIFMTWKPLDEPVEVEPQVLPSFERRGFTVVEWGGTEIN